VTPATIRAELRKITGRRAVLWGAVVAQLLVFAGVLVNRAVQALRAELAGGGLGGEAWILQGGLVVTLIGAAVIGAQTGAYDSANGTFRFLLLSGRSRVALFAARVVAFLIAVVLVLLPSAVLFAVGAFALPRGSQPAPEVGAAASYLWAGLLDAWVYGLIALAIGALLRSNGPAIAIALPLNLVAFPLLLQVSATWNPRLVEFLLPVAVVRLGSGGETSALVAAAAVLLWVGAFLAAGAWRTAASEY